jgi:hypothetical protein
MPIIQVPTPITQVSPQRREGNNLDSILELFKVQLMQSVAQNIRPPSPGGGGGGGNKDSHKDGGGQYRQNSPISIDEDLLRKYFI